MRRVLSAIGLTIACLFFGQLASYASPPPTTEPPPEPNTPPQVNAGPAVELAEPGTVTLIGSVVDDGLPDPPAAVSVAWSATGPGGVSFTDPSATTTDATFPVEGSYVVRLEASDGALTGLDELTVTVAAAPEPEPEAGSEPVTSAEFAAAVEQFEAAAAALSWAGGLVVFLTAARFTHGWRANRG